MSESKTSNSTKTKKEKEKYFYSTIYGYINITHIVMWKYTQHGIRIWLQGGKILEIMKSDNIAEYETLLNALLEKTM